jgi:hypothetical protein
VRDNGLHDGRWGESTRSLSSIGVTFWESHSRKAGVFAHFVGTIYMVDHANRAREENRDERSEFRSVIKDELIPTDRLAHLNPNKDSSIDQKCHASGNSMSQTINDSY